MFVRARVRARVVGREFAEPRRVRVEASLDAPRADGGARAPAAEPDEDADPEMDALKRRLADLDGDALQLCLKREQCLPRRHLRVLRLAHVSGGLGLAGAQHRRAAACLLALGLAIEQRGLLGCQRGRHLHPSFGQLL
ncbi:MAG: hypothetical protein VX113_08855, partial [Pseudomonadota bacterium]|nr:hypothetical protein [Pseudomonadota bacterium]